MLGLVEGLVMVESWWVPVAELFGGREEPRPPRFLFFILYIYIYKI